MSPLLPLPYQKAKSRTLQQYQHIMNRLHSEHLLSAIKHLDSNEMVRVMRVCKRWFELIDQSSALWQRLILPSNQDRWGQEKGWSSSILELFDKKSGSSLLQVSMNLEPLEDLPDQESEDFLPEILLRSKGTLRYLLLFSDPESPRPSLSDLSWKLPHLVECVIDLPRGFVRRLDPVRLKYKSQASDSNSSLETLWLYDSDSVIKSHTRLLDSVVSLHLGSPLTSKELREVLEKPSKNLKELAISLTGSQKFKDFSVFYPTPPTPTPTAAAADVDRLPDLEFPTLKVLSVDCDGEDFPCWMRIPVSCTLIIPEPTLPQGLPSVSKLWTLYPGQIHRLEDRCPLLTELRIEEDEEDCPVLDAQLFDAFVEMLRKRRARIESGMEVDGVKMIPLQRLLVSFKFFTKDQLEELEECVEVLLDVNDFKKLVKVVI